MLWYILCDLWSKKQSMLVSVKLFAIGKKEGAGVCYLCGACACVERGCTVLSRVFVGVALVAQHVLQRSVPPSMV